MPYVRLDHSPGPELQVPLSDPIPEQDPGATSVPQLLSLCGHWFSGAHPTADTSALPVWDELSVEEREVLVCAAEASGMLTGPFGIREDLPADLDAAQRPAWVDRQLAPLLPFVREGWIEVQHCPDGRSDAFTVIPLEGLRAALADAAIRYEGDEWGVGVGCRGSWAHSFNVGGQA
jgi:hypothetical protein